MSRARKHETQMLGLRDCMHFAAMLLGIPKIMGEDYAADDSKLLDAVTDQMAKVNTEYKRSFPGQFPKPGKGDLKQHTLSTSCWEDYLGLPRGTKRVLEATDVGPAEKKRRKRSI